MKKIPETTKKAFNRLKNILLLELYLYSFLNSTNWVKILHIWILMKLVEGIKKEVTKEVTKDLNNLYASIYLGRIFKSRESFNNEVGKIKNILNQFEIKFEIKQEWFNPTITIFV